MDIVATHQPPAGTTGTTVAVGTASRRRWRRWGLMSAFLVWVGWQVAYVYLGPNFHCIAPGHAYRSAQTSADWLRQTMDREGIRSVVNLRGDGYDSPWYVNERRVVLERGSAFENVMLSAAFAPHQRDLRLLVRVLDRLPKPVLIHCHGGADRSGLAAAVYLLLYTDTPIDEARRQLSWRYGHFAYGRSACLQNVLDQYEDWLAGQQLGHQPERLREWIMRIYRKAT